MQAGRLRDRVIILSATAVHSPSGHPVETVTEGATVWVEVKGISGREIISGGAETAQATIRTWMRFRRDVTAASRLRVLTSVLKGAILDIEGPLISNACATRLEIFCSLKGNVRRISALIFSAWRILHGIWRRSARQKTIRFCAMPPVPVLKLCGMRLSNVRRGEPGNWRKVWLFSLSVQSVGGKLSRVSTFADGVCELETVITAWKPAILEVHFTGALWSWER